MLCSISIKAYRYRIQSHKAIIKIVNIVNSGIYNSVRLFQFKEVYRCLDISFKEPVLLAKDSY
jgi:hypothetical protein